MNYGEIKNFDIANGEGVRSGAARGGRAAGGGGGGAGNPWRM